jgi:diadenosine tetraphosphate (Ap4A) HIT family hydrolase
MQKRQSWMLGDFDELNFGTSGPSGSQKRQKAQEGLRDHLGDTVKQISKYELNPTMTGSAKDRISSTQPPGAKKPQSKAANQWKAAKINRLLEQAQREHRKIEDLALERYGDINEFYREAEEAGIYLGSKSHFKSSSNKGFMKPGAELKADDFNVNQRQSLSVSERLVAMNAAAKSAKTYKVEELNQLRAEALRAKLEGLDSAKELQAEFERAKAASSKRVVVDHGVRTVNEDITSMLLAERTSRRGTLDTDYAKKIGKDRRFNDNLDYLDDNAQNLSSTSDQRKQILGKPLHIQDCWYCTKEDDAPEIPVIACGYKVYLGLLKSTPLVSGHCVIVPLEHHVSTLECDDDEWTEIRNFMKCLIRAFHSKGKGVIFTETAMHFRSKHHCVIECIPVPFGVYEQAPAYFKQSILAADEEWSQNKKLINTGIKGFRRSLVKQIPYFHVWFGLDEGYGHVVENEDLFPRLFGRQVLGSMLSVPSERYRKPEVLEEDQMSKLKSQFRAFFEAFDWTKELH